MTDIALLREKIDDSGMTVVAISQKSGIDRATLYNRLKGKGEFTASEIIGMTEALHLTKPERDRIFLTANVN